MSQGLRGFVGQGMDGRKAVPNAYVREFLPGTYSYTVPYSGRWKFVLRGKGGNVSGLDGGGSGAYAEKTVLLNAGQVVAIVIGSDTTVTFPGYPVVTAGGAVLGAAGVASGGDVMYNGSAGGTAGANGSNGLGPGGGAGGTGAGGLYAGGAGAPGTVEFPGGNGRFGNNTLDAGITPGGGSSITSGGATASPGDGQVTALYYGG